MNEEKNMGKEPIVGRELREGEGREGLERARDGLAQRYQSLMDQVSRELERNDDSRMRELAKHVKSTIIGPALEGELTGFGDV